VKHFEYSIADYRYIKKFLSHDLCDYLTTSSLTDKKPVKDKNFPESRSFHSRHSIIYKHLLNFLLPRVEKETNLKLKPTYCFSRIYYPGANLKKHKDRSQCEISVSITLNYSYAIPNYKWPLCMGDLPIVIEKGDGVIYKGCEISHWRPIFNVPKISWHHQVFIHYVDKNGPNKNVKED